MRLLRKLLIGILIMVALAIVKRILAKVFPAATPFHANLCGCLQLFVFTWIFISFLAEIIFFRSMALKKAQRLSFLLWLTVILLLELFSAVLLHRPSAIPAPLLSAYRIYYENYQRNVLQYDTAIAHYDPELFYSMRKGIRSTFSNLEFSDSIISDALGFRNTGEPRGTPQIFCLGDSYTLGWGVNQTETYPARLASLTGCRITNTGMSSYGTAREIFSIKKLIDTSSTIIIQYCNNDAEENEAFVQNNFQLKISPQQTYDSAIDALKWAQVYFTGKYFGTIAKIFLKEKLKAQPDRKIGKGQRNPDAYNRQTVTDFLEVLKHSGVDFSKRRLIVMDLGDFAHLDNVFLDALEKQVASPAYQQVFAQFRICRLSAKLNPDDFYLLDAHLRPSGQSKVAAALAALIDTCRN